MTWPQKWLENDLGMDNTRNWDSRPKNCTSRYFYAPTKGTSLFLPGLVGTRENRRNGVLRVLLSNKNFCSGVWSWKWATAVRNHVAWDEVFSSQVNTFSFFGLDFALALLPPHSGCAGHHVDRSHLPSLEVLPQVPVPGRCQVPGVRRIFGQTQNVPEKLAGQFNFLTFSSWSRYQWFVS